MARPALKILYTLALAALFLVCLAPPALANPVTPDMFGFAASPGLFLLASISALGAEYILVSHFLRPYVRYRHVVLSFLAINLITYPVTAIFGLFFAWFAEIIPLTLEPLMYRWYLSRAGAKVPKLGWKIVGANLVSFLIGLIIYYTVEYYKR